MIAAAYCKSINMRLPTEAEALGISGNNNASCAFPGLEHMDLNLRSERCNRNRDRQLRRQHHLERNQQLPRRYPVRGGNIRRSGSCIQTQPQPTTVNVGQAATFTVSATGTPAPSYQWLNNGNIINGATGAVYITPPTVATDNGTSFSVTVSNGSGTITSIPRYSP